MLAGLLLGAIAVFVIDKHYSRAIVFSMIAAILAAVGLIHDPVGLIWDPSTGIVRTPNPVWIGYVFGAIVIAAVAWRENALSSTSLRDALLDATGRRRRAGARQRLTFPRRTRTARAVRSIESDGPRHGTRRITCPCSSSTAR